MIRDPFNIHRSQSAFKAATTRDEPRDGDDEKRQADAQAYEMAFSMPKNLPAFSNPQRQLEDRFWGSGARSERLPMYKDKPLPEYERPLLKRKRVVGSLGFFVLFVLYLTGFFSSSKDASAPRKGSTGQWGWLSKSPEADTTDWDARREQVKDVFTVSWDAYKRYGWGYDEYHPISKVGRNMAPKGLGWIIVDSLDTMMLMNLTSRVKESREWIANSLTWDQDQDVNTFETTIRMLGGLLAAHYISNEFPQLAPLTEDDAGEAGEDLYLEKAKDLADRLMSAFESKSGIPYASVNLGKFQGIPSHADGGASSTAEATSLQLEFKYLAKLTGEQDFWERVEKVMEIVDGNGAQDGLLPIFIDAKTGMFQGDNVRLGSRGDSYYEYLAKQSLQTNETIYMDMWDQAMDGVRKHLVTYTEHSQFTIIAERPEGLTEPMSPKMDHLVCFMPGTIALAATGGLTEAEARKLPTWSKRKDDDMQLARELMQTCWGMYKYMATGLAAEITYFNIADPPLPASAPHSAPATFDSDPEAPWRKDFEVHSNDVHNLQRPETVESLFYMWRITGDVRYREWGWDMFNSFLNYTEVPEKGGYTSLHDANKVPPKTADNMESFWLAETLKYMYLLFSPSDLLPLDKMVLNTEAHPMPRFDMGKWFKTGWERKPRDAHGTIKEQKTTG